MHERYILIIKLSSRKCDHHFSIIIFGVCLTISSTDVNFLTKQLSVNDYIYTVVCSPMVAQVTNTLPHAAHATSPQH